MIFKILVSIVLLFLLILSVSYHHHRKLLQKEQNLMKPLGKLVEVDEHKMSIFIAGKGDRTIVFLSGGGTPSPILDFKALTSRLTDSYRIVVIEKFGYGFSDDVKEERPIAKILENSRAALQKAGVEGPYVLLPHSISGIEAIYWAQQYPDEVSAIIGLDMAMPAVYDNYPLNPPLIDWLHAIASLGLTRWFPKIVDKGLFKHNQLTEQEKSSYRAIFHRRPLSDNVVQEVKAIKANSRLVKKGKIPQVPTLLFTSNGQGTNLGSKKWQQLQKDYAKEVKGSQIISLNVPHYVHDYAYEKIAVAIKTFLN